MRLLSLADGHEAGVVVDALVGLANVCEAAGDEHTAKLADDLAERARALRELDNPWLVQWLRGYDPRNRRPQG